ncbi:MAG: hypothetical protein LBB47_06835 [Spirochaetaceae bacterium]|jgi:hypothetical protein|nr:hypothetical protein [Spirochaetaceae bacterium]
MKKSIFVMYVLFLTGPLFAETRNLEELFPGTDASILGSARGRGYSHSMKVSESDKLTIKPVDEIDMTRAVLRASPMYIIENLLILKNNKPVTKLDIYNALCMISTLQGREYFSSTRGRNTVMFEEASRISGANNLKKQKDPPYTSSMPSEETMFIMVKDANFGNCYYRAEIKTAGRGIRYSLSNFKSINYFIPVIKQEKLLIQLYLEPVSEGVLVYGLTGVDAADFAEARVDIPSTITKRLDVIYGWILDNIKKL